MYRKLIPDIGKGVIWGRGITLRYIDHLHIGDRVVIDDYSVIDARGAGDAGIKIGDDGIIGRNVVIQAKVGAISIGKEANIGSLTCISSQGGIIIGDKVNILEAGDFIIMPANIPHGLKAIEQFKMLLIIFKLKFFEC